MSLPIDIIAKKQYRPKDPDYFKTYYQDMNKGVYIGCPSCGRPTSKVNLSKHMKRNICLRVFIARELADRLEQIDIPDLDPSRN